MLVPTRPLKSPLADVEAWRIAAEDNNVPYCKQVFSSRTIDAIAMIIDTCEPRFTSLGLG